MYIYIYTHIDAIDITTTCTYLLCGGNYAVSYIPFCNLPRASRQKDYFELAVYVVCVKFLEVETNCLLARFIAAAHDQITLWCAAAQKSRTSQPPSMSRFDFFLIISFTCLSSLLFGSRHIYYSTFSADFAF